MEIFDSLALDASGLAFTRDGFLVGDAKVSRAGNVQHYLGRELGLTGDDAGRVFGVYRDPATVFDEDSMRSLVGRPVTRGHPPKGVNADNWKELTVGQVGGRVVRDGEHVVAPMAIMDAASAKEVADGARSLSAGYSVEIVPDEGIAPDGTPYQYRQAGPLRFNHVAYLPDNNPRAGNTRFGDSHWGPAPLTQYELALVDRARGQQHQHGDDKQPSTRNDPMSDKTILVDGLSVVTNDAGAQAIGKLQQQLKDAQNAAATADASHQVAIAAKDADIAKLEAERDDLKAKVLSDADLDQRVQQRGDLIAKAKAIHDADYSGKTDAEVRKVAVVAKLGDAAVAGKADAYIEARFDILSDSAKPVDPVAQALRDSSTHRQPVKDNGYAASVAGLDFRTSGQKEA
ncbi:DUF2213 domain-containing protein [Mesorhizobium sp. M00.F.Ca.ET.151.01.1.1]|nr:DUF2213 domain-containing protein [bacterium M00.F.Ca.ET.199.01.1.1]TGT08760.1 DUF2213 domain-containing protein [bacterium M00.F.Ca.ET.177.01.1.1]TGT66694.1 DUF2213 domain-containing protein [Mesorhizobium sp. M00.F.Ca.ET.170.01.1.1]TGU15607.1 DUF2213 domain-containing protein [bacterium M00.F.Ca.ET.163.01.1.1]TGU98333.1 DUF2213 domain-containing protein [Mesorhizobium sp. M00.F.Ca.ET.151.01.1.1]TGV59999.1 DUF2213 domain-containing protein [bacterium M00.F.Ca.ET.141.01.1.1]